MNCKLKHIWTIIALLSVVMKPVNVQFAVPMFPPPPPPIYAVPAPMPIIGPALCPIPVPGEMLPSKTTTTTTTTRKPETIAVAVPVPMPMPMPIPVGVPVFASSNYCQGPPPRPKGCPPCPPCVCNPSCTPAFYSYCSPCHMKCRCRSKEDTPEPLPNRPAQNPAYGMPVPMPVMGPPPVVVVPFPPPIQVPIRQPKVRYEKPKRVRKYSSCSEESTDTSSSSESDYIRRRRYKKRKRYGFRRSLSSDGENELVKPMLSYIADNGDVKFKTKISEDDVAELLGEREPINKKYQTVHVVNGKDENNRPNVVVLSENTKSRKPERYKKVVLRGGISNHVLEDGKKELIFRPPGEKKISNLSVSFQIV